MRLPVRVLSGHFRRRDGCSAIRLPAAGTVAQTHVFRDILDGQAGLVPAIYGNGLEESESGGPVGFYASAEFVQCPARNPVSGRSGFCRVWRSSETDGGCPANEKEAVGFHSSGNRFPEGNTLECSDVFRSGRRLSGCIFGPASSFLLVPAKRTGKHGWQRASKTLRRMWPYADRRAYLSGFRIGRAANGGGAFQRKRCRCEKSTARSGTCSPVVRKTPRRWLRPIGCRKRMPPPAPEFFGRNNKKLFFYVIFALRPSFRRCGSSLGGRTVKRT